ncbi:MAG: hypothetical protein ACJASJ_001592 [Candidatus Azotimanducaceae bacterium]|jgi:hypothetical protein
MRRNPFIEAIASAQLRKAREQMPQRNSRFQPRKGRANTKVNPKTEGMVMALLAGE